MPSTVTLARVCRLPSLCVLRCAQLLGVGPATWRSPPPYPELFTAAPVADLLDLASCACGPAVWAVPLERAVVPPPFCDYPDEPSCVARLVPEPWVPFPRISLAVLVISAPALFFGGCSKVQFGQLHSPAAHAWHTQLIALRFTSVGERSSPLDPRFGEERPAPPVPLSAGVYVCGVMALIIFRKWAPSEDSRTRVLGNWGKGSIGTSITHGGCVGHLMPIFVQNIVRASDHTLRSRLRLAVKALCGRGSL